MTLGQRKRDRRDRGGRKVGPERRTVPREPRPGPGAHPVGRVRRVAGGELGRGDDLRGGRLERGAACEAEIDGGGVIGVSVREAHADRPVGPQRGHGRERRIGILAVRATGGVADHGQARRVVMPGVELEDVPGRREHQVAAECQDHRLQHVHHLGDVGHAHALGVGDEGVEREAGEDGVADGLLLVEFVRTAAGFDGVPGAPFVDDQGDAPLGVVMVHLRGVLAELGVHVPSVPHHEVPAGAVELRGVELGRQAAVHVVVQREPAHHLGEAARRGAEFEQCFVPGEVVSAGDAEEGGFLVGGQVGAVAAELVGVEIRLHVAAAAIAFVAHAPVTHAEGLGVAVGRAEVGERSAERGVEVLDPVAHLLHGAAAEVAADDGLATDLLTKVEELVGAEGVGFGNIPNVVVLLRPPLARPDAVAPVVGVGEAAAGPAQVGHLDRAEGGNDVLADTAHVGDRRILADPDALVHAAAKVFGKLTEEVPADLRPGLTGVDGEVDDGLGHGAGGTPAIPPVAAELNPEPATRLRAVARPGQNYPWLLARDLLIVPAVRGDRCHDPWRFHGTFSSASHDPAQTHRLRSARRAPAQAVSVAAARRGRPARRTRPAADRVGHRPAPPVPREFRPLGQRRARTRDGGPRQPHPGREPHAGRRPGRP